MFNLFKKKRSSTKLLQEEFVDTQLPILSNSIGYIAHGYKQNDPEYTESICKNAKKTLEPLVNCMDKHNSGTEAYGYPYSSITPAPASTFSHSISTPVDSTTFTIAAATSGPIPSPGISVTLYIFCPPIKLQYLISTKNYRL